MAAALETPVDGGGDGRDGVHLFGIRHHGPGCARSLLQALEALAPDCLLIEGPPDAEEVLPFVLDAGLVPPVALLLYNPDDSRQAAFYPFAVFSPEWQALRYGLQAGIPTRFFDLPQIHQLALHAEARAAQAAQAEGAVDEADAKERAASPAEADAAAPAAEAEPAAAAPVLREDPLNWLGRAAGYADGEAWWNHMVEERGDGAELFAAIREAMTAVRSEAPPPADPFEQRREALREAYMRKGLREAQKAGHRRIAVVCGAWHVPALQHLGPAKADNELLKGLPKVKTAATWVPWSNGNLARSSGYGAGIEAPAWYEHLWQQPDREHRQIGWLAKAAQIFRREDLDCSPAQIIDAVRLADSLAAMRERPSPGLEELEEALRTVVCMGDDTALRLVRGELVVGDRLGQVPAAVPTVPLQRDLEQQQKRLRLKPEALARTLDLDLRQDNDLARSHLLHRLALLGVPWGRLSRQGQGGKGTFHEIWKLQWEPGLALDAVEASRWGNTIEDAATRRAVSIAAGADSVVVLADLADQVLLADLAGAIQPVTQALENLAAVASDANQLLEAIPPLANIARYGNVRRTDAGLVAHVLEGLIARAAIGLAGACASLDDAAAATMVKRISETHAAIRLVASGTQQQEWHGALERLSALGGSHGLVTGLATRLLFDDQQLVVEVTATRMSRALSIGNEPAPAAAWLEGFLNRSSLVLLHDDALWSLVDQWVGSLSGDHFLRVLPLVRRTFAAFSGPERRQLGERVQRSGSAAASLAPTVAAEWDAARAARPIPLLKSILGLPQ